MKIIVHKINVVSIDCWTLRSERFALILIVIIVTIVATIRITIMITIMIIIICSD